MEPVATNLATVCPALLHLCGLALLCFVTKFGMVPTHICILHLPVVSVGLDLVNAHVVTTYHSKLFNMVFSSATSCLSWSSSVLVIIPETEGVAASMT